MMINKQNQAKYSSLAESKTVKVEIPDFTNKMNGVPVENIESPTFTIRGKDLSIQVNPNDRNAKNIGVYLHNYSKDTITAKFTVKSLKNDKPGSVETVLDDRTEFKADQGWGNPKYKSHKEYRWFIKSDDDVFRLEFEVTLYFTAEDLDCPKKRYPVSSN